MTDRSMRRISHVYEFGPFRLEVEERRLLCGGETIALTTKVFDLLVELVRSSGHLVRKEHLIHVLWADASVEPGSLTVAIATLRKVLGTDENYIETVPKQGYRFSGRVREVTFSANQIGTRSRDHSKLDLIVVLPLTTPGGGPKQRDLSASVTELVIRAIGHSPGLRVVPYAAVTRYADASFTMDQIIKDFKASMVLTGQLIELKNRTVISIELVDIENGWHLWGDRIIFRVTTPIDLQAAIARQIPGRVISAIAKERGSATLKRYTQDTESYQLYLEGRYFWSRFTVEGFKKSLEYFRSITERNPKYALAYAGIADSYYGLCTTLMPPAEVMPLSRDAASRALAIDDEVSEAHAALAISKMNFEWAWEAAENEFRLAIALDPKHLLACFRYATFLLKVGRFDEAHAQIERALSIDPLSLPSIAYRGAISYFERNFDKAIPLLQKAVEMNPYYHPTRGRLASAYTEVGRYEEAIDEIKSAREIEDLPQFLAKLGYAYAMAGRRDDAVKVLGRLSRLQKSRFISPFFIGVIQGALGNKDLAFESLDRAVDIRDEMPTYLLVSPELDTLRSDPRFNTLLQRVNFTQIQTIEPPPARAL
jgi:DNA-binding winged helix-turn-helix (wHTH) protein/Tfp pilus assembly protein PilF